MIFLRDLNLKTKLFLGFFVIILVLVFQGFFSFNVSKRMSLLSSNIYFQNLIPINTLSKLNPHLYQYRWELLLLIEELESDDLIEEFEKLNSYSKPIDQFFKRTEIEDEIERYKLFKKELLVFKKNWAEVREIGDQLENYIVTNPNFSEAVAIEYILSSKQFLDKAIETNENLAVLFEKEAKKAYDSTQEIVENKIVNMITFIVLGVIISIILSLFIASLIISPIKELMKSAKSINDGNLDTEVSVQGKDEIGLLGLSFNKMRISIRNKIEAMAKLNQIIEEQNKNLEKKVEQRTKEIQDLLNAIQQGIITMNPDFSLSKEHSLKAEEIFGTEKFEGVDIFSLLKLDQLKSRSFRNWFRFFSKPNKLKRWRHYVQTAPNELTIESEGKAKNIRLSYRPILKGNELEKLMILGEDISELKLLEREKEREKSLHEKEMNNIIALSQNEKESIRDFLELGTKVLEKLESSDFKIAEIGMTRLFRDVHTLKGNSGILGFDHFSSILHKIEDYLQDRENPLEKSSDQTFKEFIEKAKTEFGFIQGQINELFPYYSSDSFLVSEKHFNQLVAELRNAKLPTQNKIFGILLDLKSEELEVLVKKYDKMVRSYAAKHRKPVEGIIKINPKALVPRKLFSDLDESLVHIFRNAIAYGINEDQMIQENFISIKYITKEGFVGFEVKDNGKGIDLEMIVERAVQKQLIAREEVENIPDDEKLNIIFLDGFSSTDRVSEMSGRGVGMSAVKKSLEGLGGNIEIESKINRGTTFRIWVPYEKTLELSLSA